MMKIKKVWRRIPVLFELILLPIYKFGFSEECPLFSSPKIVKFILFFAKNLIFYPNCSKKTNGNSPITSCFWGEGV